MSYGLLVEGDYDREIVPVFVRRLMPSADVVRVLACGGKSKWQKLPGYLNDLQYARGGQPVEKVLVVTDCDQRAPESVERDLEQRIPPWARCFPRGVKVCGVRQTIETWLMVDASAINGVAREREAKGKLVQELQRDIEGLADPKRMFRQILSQAGLEYTPVVCREIASRIDLDRLRGRCPSFRSFEQKATDC